MRISAAAGLTGLLRAETSATTANPLFRSIPASASGITFIHESAMSPDRYLPETMGAGAAFLDFDNDGWMDIYLVNAGPCDFYKPGKPLRNALYRNNRDGTFTDVTEKAGVPGGTFGMGVAVGDYDNDGFEDLYVTAYGGNKLYHNNGNGTFTDVTERAAVSGSGWSTSAAWVDLDQDGKLDLVVLRYLDWDFSDIWCGEHREGYRSYCHPDVFKTISPLVYHNEGGGRFTEVAQKTGLGKPGKGLGIAIADFDRDGRVDIFVANDSMPEFLFRNKGDGTFEEGGLVSGAAVDGEGRTYAGMGVDFADYNNDGLPDIVVTDLANQVYPLYQNNGDGTFDYVSSRTEISRITFMHSGWGIRFLDFDNDGWKDLLIAQGHDLDTIELTSAHIHYRETALLLRNNGKGFSDVSSESGAVFGQAWVGRGLATGDLDNDGRVDAVITTNDGGLRILHNETTNQNHWITFQLVGHKSNRDGIGAEIKAITAKGSQYSTVTTSGSYLSSSDKRAHFGLGSASKIETLEIRWPSGIVQTLRDISVDRLLTVDEPFARPPVNH
jgi:enediyne biosynthesis protein E4